MNEWLERIKKGDIFPIFIVGAIVGMVLWMVLNGFPWGIILTIAALGIAFGVVELISKLTIKKTVSQQFWWWINKCEIGENKYIQCPNCGNGLVFPNRRKGLIFSIAFTITILIVTVGHLVIK